MTKGDYLLSATHTIGRFKARFFAALGFSSLRWAELAEAFRLQHLTQARGGCPGRRSRPAIHDSRYSGGADWAVKHRCQRLVHSSRRRRATFGRAGS